LTIGAGDTFRDEQPAEPITPDGAFAKPASVESVMASLETITEEPGGKDSGGKLPPVKNGSA